MSYDIDEVIYRLQLFSVPAPDANKRFICGLQAEKKTAKSTAHTKSRCICVTKRSELCEDSVMEQFTSTAEPRPFRIATTVKCSSVHRYCSINFGLTL